MTELSNKKYITKKISRFIKSAQNVLSIEISALNDLAARLDERFEHACALILACTGRIVVTGMGKSGHIARKIAATLASTGTPAFFMHPAEASHGDIGMITETDLVIAISYSGETPEILGLLPSFKQFGIPVIAICGKPSSTLAKQAQVHLNVQVSQEACPLGLAPTASTTATLAIGDALAIALLEERQFTAQDFARFHPGGSLGKRLMDGTRSQHLNIFRRHRGGFLGSANRPGTWPRSECRQCRNHTETLDKSQFWHISLLYPSGIITAITSA